MEPNYSDYRIEIVYNPVALLLKWKEEEEHPFDYLVMGKTNVKIGPFLFKKDMTPGLVSHWLAGSQLVCLSLNWTHCTHKDFGTIAIIVHNWNVGLATPLSGERKSIDDFILWQKNDNVLTPHEIYNGVSIVNDISIPSEVKDHLSEKKMKVSHE